MDIDIEKSVKKDLDAMEKLFKTPQKRNDNHHPKKNRHVKRRLNKPKLRKKKKINKKGAIENQLIGILIAFGFLVAIVVVYFLWSMVAPIFVYTADQATNIIQEAAPQELNIANYTNTTLGSANRLLQGSEWLSYGLLVAMFIGFCFVAYFVRSYPFLIIFWLGFCGILVFVSLYFAITYQDLRTADGYLAAAYQGWGVNDFILQNLPQVVIAFALIGGLIMFILVSTDSEAEVVI